MSQQPCLSQFGRRVQALRLEKGWTQEQASENANLNCRHWQKIEAGDGNVTFHVLLGVARGLGVDVSALVAGLQP